MVRIIIVPFHIGDLMTGTSHMDATEFGAYMALLFAHYNKGPDGLDYDKKRLALMAKCSSKVWKRISPIILKKFEIITSDDGTQKIIHHRVIDELHKIEHKSTQNSAKALKRHADSNAIAGSRHDNGNAIHKPKSKNPPISPQMNNLEKASFQNWEGGKDRPIVFHIDHHINDDDKAKARENAPGWDIYFLMRIYDEGIANGSRPPPDRPAAAFIAWCKSYTKGKQP